MRVAVLSDVHGYAPAFQAVLDDIERSNIDQIIVGGDHCEGGPNPTDVLRMLKEHDCRCVYGNTDRDLYENNRPSNAGFQWTRQRLGEDGLEFLRSLPFSVRISHQYAATDGTEDLLVVHANPADVDRHLSPNASEREVLEIIGDEPAHTIAFGHLHVSYVRTVADRTLVDVSAVGSPRDGDLRPRYVVFDDERMPGRWHHEYRYVDYPVEQTEHAMEMSGMPGWEKSFKKLLSAQYNRSI